ncbi:MAG: F0F1 ATP synthase subunit A [Candidatus Omnitrophota bacterium]|nr:F0F1 ATP synthase subunit A [Candidatus Omnitrophota bacterium]
MHHGEIPNLVTILAGHLKSGNIAQYLYRWENIIFSVIALSIISIVAYLAYRKINLMPSRLQGAFELFVAGVDDFVCGIIGHKGRQYTPFIGTLFIYILFMNLLSLVPFMKSPTTSWSITLALAVVVFFYVQYAGIKELGFLGYIDHMLGKPRGIMAISVVMPLMMLFLHVVSELVRPISLSLRLRSNIWGDDMLLSLMAGFGIKGIPLLLFNSVLALLASVVQATVFCLLTTIYFALVLSHEEEEKIGPLT